MAPTQIRITGPNGSPFKLGGAMHLFEGKTLLGRLDPVCVLKDGTEVHMETFVATQVVLNERRHVGQLLFCEVCAHITERFPQIQAISFAFARPIDTVARPAELAAMRAAAMQRVGVVNVAVTPMSLKAHVVSGVWPYSRTNVAALREGPIPSSSLRGSCVSWRSCWLRVERRARRALNRVRKLWRRRRGNWCRRRQGFNVSALARMVKFAEMFPREATRALALVAEPNFETHASKIAAMSSTQLSEDGLRYIKKRPGTIITTPRADATMSCFKCGRFALRSQMRTLRLLGKNHLVCAPKCP